MSTPKIDNFTVNELSEQDLQEVIGGFNRLPSDIWPRFDNPPSPSPATSPAKSALKGAGKVALRGTAGYVALTTIQGLIP